MMKKLMADQQPHTAEMIKKVMVDQQAQATAMRNLERQVGQLASAQNTRPVGALPSDTVANPKASINVVSLRNGRQFEEVQSKKRKHVTFNERPVTIESESKKSKECEKPAEEAVAKQPSQLVARPPPPFPQRFQKVKDNAAYKKFLDILKQVQINIPLVDILQEVPKYAKYIKDIVANTRRLAEFETVALTEECSSRIQSKIPHKLKDPGSFTIQISIGKRTVGRALCDLGASINLMLLSEFRQLGLGEPRPTTVILQLVDRSLAHLEGVIEDVSPIDPLERALIGDEEDSEDEMMEEIEKVLDMSCSYVHGFGKFEELDRPITLTPPKPSIEEAPKLELKPLPVHLRYTYLGNSETLPVIISSNLTNTQEEKLFRVLREHKKLLGGQLLASMESVHHFACIKSSWKMDTALVLSSKGATGLARYEYYCFLDGYSGYNQIVICPEDQEKTTFTCPYGTFAFKRMPFGLCNAPATFQRCMMTIFTDMVERFVKVFMDDFSEGIVLGHRVSRSGIKVDKAKVEAVEKLPPPISVKGVRSFLGHAGFYRRFIKDFSKITTPLWRLLEKDITFNFDDACLKEFE
ncbi:uncharacterized protein LOC107785474 [Nicotiana tabacum]|uniref:Uncharacterized protein LOC107785474 n=1 Tax=Nicotiana tabacum TaxID=4097 RepID=A0AC58TNN7_TOBAC